MKLNASVNLYGSIKDSSIKRLPQYMLACVAGIFS